MSKPATVRKLEIEWFRGIKELGWNPLCDTRVVPGCNTGDHEVASWALTND